MKIKKYKNLICSLILLTVVAIPSYLYARYISQIELDKPIELKIIPNYYITFNSNGGTMDDMTGVENYLVDSSQTKKLVTKYEEFGAMPSAEKYDLIFRGWYDSEDYENQIKDDSIVNFTGDQMLYAKFETYLCKPGHVLHTEECTNNSATNIRNSRGCGASGFLPNGSRGTSTIEYGTLVEENTIKSGDAFNCDVNGDGVYDDQTERFYYVTDMDSETSVFIYYTNLKSGVPNNTSAVAYSIPGSPQGPVSAIVELPTINQWPNMRLSYPIRAIKTQTGGTESYAGQIPQAFDYSDYAARLLTTDEVMTACNITELHSNPTTKDRINGQLDGNCIYMMENTTYATESHIYGYHLENPVEKSSLVSDLQDQNWWVHGGFRNLGLYPVGSLLYRGVRPAIEIPKYRIKLVYDD